MDTHPSHDQPREDGTQQFAERTRSAAEDGLLNLDDPQAETHEQAWVPYWEMPKSNLREAVARIERANKRLERAGIHERFTYEVEEFVHFERDNPIGVAAVKLTLNRPKIGRDGWKFVAAHELTADDKILNYGPAKIDEMRCDHCGHNRRRGKVYTVKGPDGETAVVGSNCLSAFLGIKPEGLWTLEFDLDPKEKDTEERWSAATGDVVITPLDLIGAGLAASDDGESYVSRSRSTWTEPATVDRVIAQLRTMIEAGKAEERRARAAEILAWVNEQPDGEDDYIDNLRTVLAGEGRQVAKKHFGLGVSAIGAYRYAKERAARKEVERKTYTPGFLAPKGEMVRDREVTIVFARFYENAYSGSTRIVMRDNESGHMLTWKASGNKAWEMETGDVFKMTAKVRDHDQYDGIDQTVIERAKYQRVESPDEAKPQD